MTAPAPRHRISSADLPLVEMFTRVAELGGFAAAQIELNVSASTISKNIAALEARLGATLCRRGRAGFSITEEGAAVCRAAQKLRGALNEFDTELGAIKGHLVGVLSISTIDNWVAREDAPLVRAIRAFKRQAPQVEIDIQCQAPNEIEQSLMTRRVSFGLGVFHTRRPRLEYMPLSIDPIGLFCGRRHRMFEGLPGPVPAADIAECDYVRRSYLSEERAAPSTAGLRSTAQAHQIEGSTYLILTGAYIGYLPIEFAKRWVDAGEMREIDPERYRVDTPIELATLRGRVPGEIDRRFARIILGERGAQMMQAPPGAHI